MDAMPVEYIGSTEIRLLYGTASPLKHQVHKTQKRHMIFPRG